MNSKTQRILISLLIPATALGLAGCASADDAGSGVTEPAVPTQQQAETQAPAESEQPAQSAAPAPSEQAPSDQNASVDASEYADAIAAAEAAVGDGAQAVQLDRDDDNDERFEIDVIQGDRTFEVDVAADGSTRIDDTDDDDDDDRCALEVAELTMLDAIEAALAFQPGLIEEVELEEDDGVFVWDIEYDDDSLDDLDVNVITGEVTKDD